MAYVDKLLARDEKVILQSRRHPLFMVLNSGPYILGAVLLWALAVLAWLFVPEAAGIRFDLILAAVLFVASFVPLAIGLYRVLHWMKEQYFITNFRILQVEGFVNRRTFDSALEKVNDVVMTQSIFGRMFDYGSINIVTGSDAAINDIAGVSKPYEFKRALLETKMAFGSRNDGENLQWATPQPAAPAEPMPMYDAHTDRLPEVGGQHDQSRVIIALTELRNSGVISDAEYSEKLRKLTRPN